MNKKEGNLLQPEAPQKVKEFVWYFKIYSRIIKFLKKKGIPFPNAVLVIIIIIILVLITKVVLIPFFRETGSFRYGSTYFMYATSSSEYIYFDDNLLKQAPPITVIGNFGTTILNISSKNKYLENIHIVIWDKKKIGKAIAVGESLGIFSVNGNKIATTTSSILFGANESKYIEGSFTITILDTNTYFNLPVGLMKWRGDFSLLMQDSRGNVFDKNGKLVSLQVIDAWWLTLFDKPFSEKVKDRYVIVKRIVGWYIISFFHWLV